MIKLRTCCLLLQNVVAGMLKLLSEKGHDHCLVLAIWSHFVHILGRVSFRLHSVTSLICALCMQWPSLIWFYTILCSNYWIVICFRVFTSMGPFWMNFWRLLKWWEALLHVTWQSHGVHITVTCLTWPLLLVFLRDSSTSCLWCKWLPTMHGMFLSPTSPSIWVSSNVQWHKWMVISASSDTSEWWYQWAVISVSGDIREQWWAVMSSDISEQWY